MRFGLMRRSSSEWIQTMSQLASRASADVSQTAALQAEARRVNDALLALRVKDNDPTLRRKTLDRMTGNLKRRQPNAAAFLVGAEAPRRYQEERQALRMRMNLAAEAVEEREPTEAMQHLRAASKMLAGIEPGVFSPEAHSDLPRALSCVELMAQGSARASLEKTIGLLLDVGARGPSHPSVAQVRVLRAMLVQLLQAWDRCDLLWEHKRVDSVLPSLLTLLQVEHLFELDHHTREAIADGIAGKCDDLQAFQSLSELAANLEDEQGASADAAALVRFCAERRLRDCYFAAQDCGTELNCLMPQPSAQWQFNNLCQKTLETFYQEQKKAFESTFNKVPTSKSFSEIYFNADVCLRALAARNLLDKQSSLSVVAMMHYLVEEMCMMPEA